MKSKQIHRMAGIALMCAVVVVLQLLGQFIKFGPVSISLVLIPIVVGAAMYGPGAGAVLGSVFSVVVLLQPDTAVFYSESVLGTIVTVLTKGILSGWLAGVVFRWVSGKNEWLAVILSAIICPIVNTAIFSLGCRLFFWELLSSWGGGNALMYLVTGLIGFNFLAELGANIVCSPVIVRVLHAARKI